MKGLALRLLAAALVAVLLATLAGPAWGFALLAAVLGAELCRHLREFTRLRRWAAERRLPDPPEADGEWGDVFNALHRHRRAMLQRRRQLAHLIVRTRRAAQALPYGVTALDASLRLVWCNTAAISHFGIDPDRDAGQPIANFVRQPAFAEWIGNPAFDSTLMLHASGGEPRSFALQMVGFEENAWLLLSQDVTGAERLEVMRRDFVANVSHELRTPLTVLAGFLETIRDLELSPQRVRDYVMLMAPQAERMRGIIDDLLTLSSLEHAAPPVEQRIDMGRLLERVVQEARGLSAGRHRFEIVIDPELDLLGSEHELASAFTNLVANAVRYTSEGGTIRVSWRATAKETEFAVEDSGIGIAPEHIPRLTERFYRVDRGRSREAGGTGLGLAIVKHVLARHQALLEIRSEPGVGSRFTARFPAARLQVERARSDAATASPSAASPLPAPPPSP